jgi:hypothetical protein
MDIRNVYTQLDELLLDYFRICDMQVNAGPLRAMADLIRGIIFSGSVQLTNAARLSAGDDAALSYHVKRLSLALSNPHWNHQPWARGILARQGARVASDDLIPIDATELAKPYARHMEDQCIVKDASRPGDPLVPGYWCYGAYQYRPDPLRQARALLAPLSLTPYSQASPGFL